jgi:hypothetical protein
VDEVAAVSFFRSVLLLLAVALTVAACTGNVSAELSAVPSSIK